VWGRALGGWQDSRNMLDNAAGRVILKMLRKRRSVPSLSKPRLTIGAVLFVPTVQAEQVPKTCQAP